MKKNEFSKFYLQSYIYKYHYTTLHMSGKSKQNLKMTMNRRVTRIVNATLRRSFSIFEKHFYFIRPLFRFD